MDTPNKVCCACDLPIKPLEGANIGELADTLMWPYDGLKRSEYLCGTCYNFAARILGRIYEGTVRIV